MHFSTSAEEKLNNFKFPDWSGSSKSSEHHPIRNQQTHIDTGSKTVTFTNVPKDKFNDQDSETDSEDGSSDSEGLDSDDDLDDVDKDTDDHDGDDDKSDEEYEEDEEETVGIGTGKVITFKHTQVLFSYRENLLTKTS